MMNEEQLRRVMIKYEDKLIELMGQEAFDDFARDIAKDFFAEEIMNMTNSNFKQTVLDNFDAITGTEEEWQDFLKEHGNDLINGEEND